MAKFINTMHFTRSSLCHRIIIVCMAVIAIACTKPDEPTPDKPTPDKPVTPDPPTPTEALIFTGEYSSGHLDTGADAFTATISFSSSGEWTASVPEATASWCSVIPEKGNGGDIKVQIRISANTTYDERNSSIVFSTGSVRKTFVVTQKQLDAMLVSSSSKVEVEETGGSFTVQVKANVDVNYEIPSQYAGWLRFTGKNQSRALSGTDYNFAVNANNTDSPREGTIIFTGAGKTEEVKVLQIGGSTIVLSEKTIYAGADGGRFSAELKSNCEFTYSIESGSEWLHIDASRALSSHTLHFTIDPYSDINNERTAKVLFITNDGKSQDVLTVIQKPKGAIIIGSKVINAECGGGTFQIDYSTNTDNPVIKLPDWISTVNAQRASRAMENKTIFIKVQPNISNTPRQGYVVLSIEDSKERDSVLVTQKELEYSIVTSVKDGDFPDARSHEFTIDFNGNIEYTLEATEPVKKISYNTFRIPANYTKGLSGSASVQIKIAGIPIEPIQIMYTAPQEPVIESRDITAPAGAGTVNINIHTNTDIELTAISPSSWAKLGKVIHAEKGTATDTWMIEVSENTSTTPRSCIISFRAGNFWEGQVTITQDEAAKPIQNEGTADVKESGTLEQILGNRLMTTDRLSINGEIDGKDVATIRKMATEGALTELDLSGTTLHKDLQTQYYPSFMGKDGKITEDNMVGNFMFYKTNLKKVTLPVNLKSIGYYAFKDSKIEEIMIPDGVDFIDKYAFDNCTKLRKVVVPGSAAVIPDNCFFGTTALKEVSLGSGIRVIGDYAFAPKLVYLEKGELTEIKLPSTLEEIGYKAFVTTKLREIEIPATVKSIGKWAFSECRQLNKVVFNCALDTLPDRLFYNTHVLMDITFPKGLKVIGEYALDHIGADYLVIPEGVVELKTGACNGAAKKGLTLPESLEIIGPFSLGYRSQCNSFTIPSKVRFIGNRAFDGACYITELHIKNPVPPQHQGDIFFRTFDYSACTLYVPRGSAGAYAADEYWLKFKSIVEE